MIITIAVRDSGVHTMYTLRQKLMELGEFDLGNLESRPIQVGEIADYFLLSNRLLATDSMFDVYRSWSAGISPRVIVASGVRKDDPEAS